MMDKVFCGLCLQEIEEGSHGAAEYFEEAADYGFIPAQSQLSDCFDNEEESEKWFLKNMTVLETS